LAFQPPRQAGPSATTLLPGPPLRSLGSASSLAAVLSQPFGRRAAPWLTASLPGLHRLCFAHAIPHQMEADDRSVDKKDKGCLSLCTSPSNFFIFLNLEFQIRVTVLDPRGKHRLQFEIVGVKSQS
jgi:hypothetical protein